MGRYFKVTKCSHTALCCNSVESQEVAVSKIAKGYRREICQVYSYQIQEMVPARLQNKGFV